jgi:hypothetical protein
MGWVETGGGGESSQADSRTATIFWLNFVLAAGALDATPARGAPHASRERGCEPALTVARNVGEGNRATTVSR